MNSKTRRGAWAGWAAAFVLLVAAAAAALGAKSAARADEPRLAAAPQDVTSLERRLSLLEQRFSTVELSINRLEQQSRLASINPPGAGANVRDTELLLLRSEVEALRRRLAEDECGLIKVDERTLTPAAREARRKGVAAADDPCRLDADAALRLSSRR
jgi:hypothetical protein